MPVKLFLCEGCAPFFEEAKLVTRLSDAKLEQHICANCKKSRQGYKYYTGKDEPRRVSKKGART